MKQGLLTLLESKKDGRKLLGILENLKEKASELLDEIPKTFPEFTPHNIEHKERVLDRYRLLIPDELAKSMNAYEVYFLIAATYLHDVGMANIPELQEDKIHLASTRGIHGTVTGYVLGWGLPGINIFELLKLKSMSKKDQIFGGMVQVVKFLKPKNTKFLMNYDFPYEYDRKTQKRKKSKMKEFAGAIINYDNKFVQLVLNNQKIIMGDRKMAFNYFCEQIHRYSRHSIKEIIDSQKLILQWFVDDKIIHKQDVKNYVLTKNDFSRN